MIMRLAGEGFSIKEIVRRSGHSRKLVRQVIRGERRCVPASAEFAGCATAIAG